MFDILIKKKERKREGFDQYYNIRLFFCCSLTVFPFLSKFEKLLLLILYIQISFYT